MALQFEDTNGNDLMMRTDILNVTINQVIQNYTGST